MTVMAIGVADIGHAAEMRIRIVGTSIYLPSANEMSKLSGGDFPHIWAL